MFNLGLPEMLVIGAAALLVFGPKKLPELAKSLGKGIRDFKKALDGSESEEAELRTPRESLPQEAPKDTVASGEMHSPSDAEPEKVPAEKTSTDKS